MDFVGNSNEIPIAIESEEFIIRKDLHPQASIFIIPFTVVPSTRGRGGEPQIGLTSVISFLLTAIPKNKAAIDR